MYNKTELSIFAWQGQTVLQTYLLHSQHRMCLWLLLIEFVIIKATRLYCAAWRKIFLWQETHPHKDAYKSVITHIHVESWTFFLKLDGKKNSFSLLIFSEAPNKKAKDDENKEDSMEDEWDDWLVGKSSLILLFSLLTDSKVEVHRSKKSP